jgi:hypothetical protein
MMKVKLSKKDRKVLRDLFVLGQGSEAINQQGVTKLRRKILAKELKKEDGKDKKKVAGGNKQ